jgi:hypothetical protein
MSCNFLDEEIEQRYLGIKKVMEENGSRNWARILEPFSRELSFPLNKLQENLLMSK